MTHHVCGGASLCINGVITVQSVYLVLNIHCPVKSDVHSLSFIVLKIMVFTSHFYYTF